MKNNAIVMQFYKGKAVKPLSIKALQLSSNYSNSAITNQFCLEIICCRVSLSFDYLIYPYYPAYMG